MVLVREDGGEGDCDAVDVVAVESSLFGRVLTCKGDTSPNDAGVAGADDDAA